MTTSPSPNAEAGRTAAPVAAGAAAAPSSVSARERFWSPLLAALGGLHFLGLAAAVGIRLEYVLLDGALVGLAVAGPRTRHLARAALPLWLTGVLYLDLQPLLLPLRGAIHTGDLFHLDAALFPAPDGGNWPAFFADRHAPALDLLAGTAYLVYLAQFLGVFLFLYFRHRQEGAKMAWCFLAVNALGIAGYVLYPAAPPWYVLDHGFGAADLSAAPSAAGASRFDALLGISYFESFYARNPNVFGAMPSLHVAYPTVAAGFLAKRGRGPALFGIAFVAWVAFAAVYLVHHYVLDVVAGVAVGLAALVGIELLHRAPAARRARGEAAAPGGRT